MRYGSRTSAISQLREPAAVLSDEPATQKPQPWIAAAVICTVSRSASVSEARR